MATTIHYTPLNPVNNEIRVLVIEKYHESAETTCSLQTVSLSEANPFYALSYVWGDATDMQTILLNGQRIQIRKNLCDFLRSLGEALQTPLRVWVDFLCIDQSNLDERAAQVAMMGQIYSEADSVYAWLGRPTSDSEKVMNFSEQAKLLRSAGQPYDKIYMSDPTLPLALSDLLRRPYWTRLWIIQEIVLAKRLWLFCGSRYISWDDLQFALTGSRIFGSSSRRKGSLHDATRHLHHLKESRESGSVSPLRELVHKFLTAQCQDDRDKIYGLLSLTKNEDRRSIKVDYRKPLLQVLLDTYQTWASEWILEQDAAHGPRAATYAYTPALFCQELELLLPESQLLGLYQSPEVRQRITTKVPFKGVWQLSNVEFRYLTLIHAPRDPLVPINHSQGSLDGILSRPIVSQMITTDDNDIFAYTTVFPLPTDKIVNVGPIMLIVRPTEGRFTVAGRGIQQRCSATEPIFDPRLWRAQLLADTSFEIDSKPTPETSPTRRGSSRNKDAFVHVTLNAAALVEVLIASKEQDRTWSPHGFGLQHHVVDMCTSCRLATQYGRPRLGGPKLCRCLWASADSAIPAGVCVR